MTTKVIFNVDKKVKEKAMKVAKKQGVTISAILNMTLSEYANGTRKMELNEIPNAKTRRSIDAAIRDSKLGKNNFHLFCVEPCQCIFCISKSRRHVFPKL